MIGEREIREWYNQRHLKRGDNARFCIVVPNSNYLFWKFKRRKGTEQQDIREKLLSLRQWKAIFTRGGLRF